MKKRVVLLGVISIIMCLSLTGCGFVKDVDKAELTKELEGVANEITDSVENKENADNSNSDDLKLYSDDSKIVFESEQGKMVFSYSGNKITAYNLYIEYENEAHANIAVDILKANSGSEVKDVYTKGRYVVIEYNESEYEDLTVEDIKTTYSNLTEAKE